MPLPPQLTDDYVNGLFDTGRRAEDVVMPCERCGALPAVKVNQIGEEKRLYAECHHRYNASNWKSWSS
ncbi:hypothetical protein AWB67_06789 [Caballeronia terrestris]|uniref:Uncharacterized protein n=1 Tax=Caballeronia terrestris TaxID=1226301 RepID=A0A158KUQ2_9BURK|nr:hypothetical protein AWB67_06789 [Caballeronia terrestris]